MTDLREPLLEAGSVVIGKEEILAKDISRLEKAVEVLVSRPPSGEPGTINITVSGYENEARALCTIPEIRKWSSHVAERSRSLAFLDEETMGWLLPAVVPIEIVSAEVMNTQVRWPVYQALRQFYVTAFLSSFRAGIGEDRLRALWTCMGHRFQKVARKFGTTFVLDKELQATIMAVLKRK